VLIKLKRFLTVYEDIYNILIGNPWDDPHNYITSFFFIHLIAFEFHKLRENGCEQPEELTSKLHNIC